jgi:hypothetical protein
LPDSPEELLALSREIGVEGAPYEDLMRALTALEQIGRREDESVELLIRQSQILRYLIEPMTDRREAVRLARQGEEISFRVRQLAPDRVEGYYYLSLFLGFRARHQRSAALIILPRMEENGRRALSIDEGYDDAGPLRFMGTLLVQAPAWPHGIGDTEEGVELLERAVDLSDYPLNQFFLGQAYLANDDDAAACQALSTAYEAPNEGRWARVRSTYLTELEGLLERSSCPVARSGFATGPNSSPL